MEDKLKGTWTFQEVCDYLLRTGQIPRDEFDIDYSKELELMKKILMPKLNLKENPIIMASTPNQKEGFFNKIWNENPPSKEDFEREYLCEFIDTTSNDKDAQEVTE